jgi:hypothetical protein
VVFLGLRANAELVPKFHVALHASHAALPMVALEISHFTYVTLKYEDLALQVGGVSVETVKSAGLRPKSVCSGKVQTQFTVIYRPVLSSERALQNYRAATV